jgi:hypothetical protein
MFFLLGTTHFEAGVCFELPTVLKNAPSLRGLMD